MANIIELSEVNEAVELALAASKVDDATAKEIKDNIINQLKAIAAQTDEAEVVDETTETEGEEEKAPRQKSQYVIVVADSKGLITQDLVGWVLTIPEEDPVQDTMKQLHQCFYDFNATKKGRKMPVVTIGEGLENCKAGIFKERGIKVKTKTPVLVVTTDNNLPKDNSNNVKNS